MERGAGVWVGVEKVMNSSIVLGARCYSGCTSNIRQVSVINEVIVGG